MKVSQFGMSRWVEGFTTSLPRPSTHPAAQYREARQNQNNNNNTSSTQTNPTNKRADKKINKKINMSCKIYEGEWTEICSNDPPLASPECNGGRKAFPALACLPSALAPTPKEEYSPALC